MPYSTTPVSLDIPSTLRHQCSLHTSRDGHLVGIIAFEGQSPNLTWQDLEYMRRRCEELSLMAFPDYIAAFIVDLRGLVALLDGDSPILPWRIAEDECPVRVIVSNAQRAHYSSVLEPAWLAWDLDATLKDIREFLDTNYH